MQLLERPPLETREPENADALIEEAHRLRRRRWLIGTLAAAALVGAGALIAALLVTSPTGPHAASAGGSAGALPNGPPARLQVAGPMAVAPDGALYIADDKTTNGRGDRVLVRLPGGRFRVIAGTGRRGFSGDGGPAVTAELSDISDLAVGPNGTLYIADGSRVRTVSRDGVIRTIVGNGHPAKTIANGERALSAALGPQLSIALSPVGQLYISSWSRRSAERAQILRLTATGALTRVRAVVSAAPGGNRADQNARGTTLSGFDHIAVDASGNVDVAGGPGGYGIWQITPNGNAHLVSASPSDQRAGGADPVLEHGPHGEVYAGTARGILRVETNKLTAIAAFNKPLSRSVHDHPLSPLYFAVSPAGTLYSDDNGPIGYQLKPGYAHAFLQHLVAISNDRSRLLWQEGIDTRK